MQNKVKLKPTTKVTIRKHKQNNQIGLLMQNTNSRRKLLPTPHMEWKVCCTCRGILFISDDLSRAVLAKGEKKGKYD